MNSSRLGSREFNLLLFFPLQQLRIFIALVVAVIVVVV